MKKLIAILICSTLLFFTACSSSAPCCGTWTLDKISRDGTEYTIDELKALGENTFSSDITSFLDANIIIKESSEQNTGNAFIASNGEVETVEWNFSDNKIKMGYRDGILENNYLVFENNDTMLYFKKVSDSQDLSQIGNTNSATSEITTTTVAFTTETTTAVTSAPETKSDGNSATVLQTGLTKDNFTYNILSDNTVEIARYNGSESTVTIPSEIDDKDVTRIGKGAFENCTAVEEIINWADIEVFDDNCFKGCINLEEISISGDCEIIGKCAFEGCTKLETLIIWGDIVSFGDNCFKNCNSLEEVSIPGSTETIGKSAFEGCTALESVIFWGGENIGESAFKGCTSLEEISIPSDTKTIGEYAFYNCTNLEDVIIWGDDTTIGKDAFGNTKYSG